MGNAIGFTCLTINCADITLFGNIDSFSCLPPTSFPSLQKDWQRLRAATEDVRDKVELEERQDMTMLETVAQWLQRVETTQTNFNKLQTDYAQLSAANKCFGPTKFKTRYLFGKNVANVRVEVLSLLESKPEVVTQRSLIARSQPIPVEETIGMHSIFDHVWSYIEDKKVGIIGLHGMGGVDKTTLMKDLHNKLCKSSHSFDVVLWIVVSSTPNLQTVQNDIGRKLGFDSDGWKDKSQHDKATNICNILTQKKYVLFLDDVWERLDLLSVGVPLPGQTNKSKIVLSTRLREVCGYMEVNKIIKVTCLNEDEAWNLFRKKVGENIINANPDILEIAKLVAKECAGLPLALVVIGRTMASKTTHQAWNNALNRLRINYSTKITGTGEQFLPQLKFSYDSLSDDSIRSCFLYCSLYPEDYLILKEDILDKWICEGFLDGFVDLHEARNEGYEYIDTLVNASLLEETSPEEFKMHDIIREMAIWIGCECGEIKNKFFVRAGVGLSEAPKVAEFEGSERVSLMDNRMDRLNGKPNCPNLLTLFLNNAELNCIENEFFQSMPNLRVLDLSDNRNLGEIPEEEVCNLASLRYLNIRDTEISKLEVNLGKLINLKWLRIESGNELPKGVLSRLKKLQVLDVSRGIQLPESFVEEIESLVHLNDLGIGLFSDVELSRYCSSHKMASITTKLQVYKVSSTRKLFSHKMANLKSLVIRNCDEIEYLITDYKNNNYFESLKKLYIDKCAKLKDITAFVFAPNLESIEISSCPEMKELCAEWRPTPSPFPKLKVLELYDLRGLERIITLYPNAAMLLTQMTIIDCPKLKKLPFNASATGFLIMGEEEWWNGLEWEDNATRIALLPSFSPINKING